MALLLLFLLYGLRWSLESKGLPAGLIAWSGHLASVWLLCQLGVAAAGLRWSAGPVRRFDRLVVQPLFWLVVCSQILDRFGDLPRLLAAPFLQLFSTSLNVGQLLTALLGVYFVFVIAPPLAEMMSWCLHRLFLGAGGRVRPFL